MFGGDVNDGTPDAAADGGGGEVMPTEQPTGGAGTTSGTTSAESGVPEPDPTPDPTGDTEPPDAPVTAPPQVREQVGIANQTSVDGLAESARKRLEAGGWEVPAVSSFHGSVPETTVYYPDGMRAAAEALSAQFPEIGRIQPTFEGLNPTRLVVVLVEDYLDEVGTP